MNGSQGDYAEVRLRVLAADLRSEGLPQDTRSTDFVAWIKGFLLTDAKVGEVAAIETPTGRRVEGVLTRLNPEYVHTFGPPDPMLIRAAARLRSSAQDRTE